MKIILANKFYYRRGGDCIYAIELEKILKANNHEVAIFAMQHPENIESQWSDYFPSEVIFKPGPKMFEAFMRPFGTKEVERKFTKLIKDFNPDVVHLGNIHSQLSPIIAQIAKKHGIKVVWTMHDYKLLCPRYDCLKNDVEPCEECFTDKKNVLKHKCMKNSTLASYLAYYEAKKWPLKKLESFTDTFICPSLFIKNKLVQGGMESNKTTVLCNFIDVEKCKRDNFKKEDYYCYIGRLSNEKGLKTLIEAAKHLPYTLKLIGGGPLENEIKESIKNYPQIQMVGHKQWDEIKELVGNARFNVIPSECYENNPFTVIEALCLGTPILGSKNGGIPELIDENTNGMTFEAKNISDLETKINAMFNAEFDYTSIAQRAQSRFNAIQYYDNLMKIYDCNN